MSGKLNGKSQYDERVRVNADDVERSMLEVALQAVKDNPNIRRPDGRKSPYMLAAQEALRLRDQMRAKDAELETLRAQLKLALSDVQITSRDAQIELTLKAYKALEKKAAAMEGAYNDIRELFKQFRMRTVELSHNRVQSRWFRLGRRLGFYR